MRHVTAGHYFAGTIGFALLRDWYHDGEQNERRLAELRQLVERLDEFPNSLVLDPDERHLIDGYAEWASSYDDGYNPLIDAEEAVVRPLLEGIVEPGMAALDAACGTGRHAADLVARGCSVTGVDQSAAMLDVARTKVPAATFDEAVLESLPYDDASFDLAIISLALCHLADPTRAIVELGRVLRCGGTLVIADPHPMSGSVIGGQAFYGGIQPGKPMTWVRNHFHHASTYLRAFRTASLVVDDCREPIMSDDQIAASPAHAVYPDAIRGAFAGLPTLWVWVLRRDD